MSKTYRGAVIGYGNLGIRHSEVLHGLDVTELVAVCDSTPEARAKAAQQHPSLALYDDAAKMLTTERPDIVAVGTHASSHAILSLLAAEHGAHVVCEKPIAASLEEADSMVTAFDEAGLQLVIDHQ